MIGNIFKQRRGEDSVPFAEEDDFTRSYYNIESDENTNIHSASKKYTEVIAMESSTTDTMTTSLNPTAKNLAQKRAVIYLSLTVVVLIVICVCLVVVLLSLEKTNEYLNQFNECVTRNYSGDKVCQACAKKCITTFDE